jgi:DNA-binding MarR family transcriptional regulator
MTAKAQSVVQNKMQSSEFLYEPLEDHLGYQLRRAAVLLQADLTTTMKDLQLIPTTAAIMLVLAKNKNIIQMELSRILGLQRTNVSPLIINLEKHGFLSRSCHDGRSQYLQLTEQGLAQIKNIQTRLAQHTERCFSQLSASAMSNLAAAMESTLQNLDQQTSDTGALGINDQLSYQILRTSSLAMNKLVKSLAPLELIPSNASVMLMIATNPGIIQSDLGRRLGIKRANISTIISDFKDRDFIDVQSKGRAHLLFLNEKGQALVPEIEQMMAQHEQICFGQLDKTKTELTISALKCIRQQLKKHKQKVQ